MELVDKRDLKSCAIVRAGSSPVADTKGKQQQCSTVVSDDGLVSELSFVTIAQQDRACVSA